MLFRSKIFLEQNNIEVIIVEDNTCSIRATCSLGVPKVFLNKGHRFWYDPRQVSLESRRSGYMSSSNPLGILYHEIAHTKDKYNRLRLMRDNKQRASKWQIEENIKIARRVSEYATRNPIEFVAEVYAALKTGRRFDYQVMKLYNQESGKNYQRVKSFNSGKLFCKNGTKSPFNSYAETFIFSFGFLFLNKLYI